MQRIVKLKSNSYAAHPIFCTKCALYLVIIYCNNSMRRFALINGGLCTVENMNSPKASNGL